MSQEQIEDTNNLEMKGNDRPDETMDSGIVTLRSRGAGPVRESMLPDTMMDLEPWVWTPPHPCRISDDRIIVLDPEQC